jgi:hypothetical protein
MVGIDFHPTNNGGNGEYGLPACRFLLFHPDRDRTAPTTEIRWN